MDIQAMIKLNVPLALFLAALMFAFVWFQFDTYKPTLTIVHPKPDELFFDTPIFVQLDVQHFKLVPPAVFFGRTDEERGGHIHITMDDFPIFATAETQCMIGKMTGNTYVKPGRHVLRVELVKINHQSLSKPVVKIVNFQTSGGGSRP